MIANNIATSGGAEPHGVQTFTEDGTFIVPDKVTKIWVTACGGGGGGELHDTGNGGGGAACIVHQIFSVEGIGSLNITVGKGGTAGFYSSGSPKNTDGEATIIGDLVTLPGGYRGRSDTSTCLLYTSVLRGACKGLGG